MVGSRLSVMTGSLLLLPLCVGAQGVGEFDPAGSGLPLFRPSSSVVVMAKATGQWLDVPTDPHNLLGTYQYLPHYATEDARGQVFEILEREISPGLASGEDRFVAVPWTVGCGCSDEGWDQPDWVPPGDTVVFLLSQTRASLPWEGPPIFDVLGWHQPYPAGEFIPFWRHTRAEDPRWLTQREFFTYLSALPTEATFRLDPASVLESVEGWIREHPGVEEAFPLPTVLWELQRLAGPGHGESEPGGPPATH